MDNRYQSAVLAEMKPFLEENGLTLRADDSFACDTRAFRIEYSEERQMYLLLSAPVTDGTVGEYTECSSWLFDDTQTEKDAAAVGVDFCETVRKELGLRHKRPAVSAVDLPSANKNGALTESGFAKKVLDVFPQFKEDYKAHIAHYGNFLYLNFYAGTLVPQMRAVLHENNKKTVQKLVALLETGYLQGDRDTANVAVALCAAASYQDAELQQKMHDALGENQHFQQSFDAFVPVFARSKKLVAALIK